MITLSIKTIIIVAIIVTILQTIAVIIVATDNRISDNITITDFGEAFLIICCGVPAWIAVFYNRVLKDAIYLFRFNRIYCYCRLIEDEEEVGKVFMRRKDLVYFEQSKWSSNRIEVDDTLKRASMGYVECIPHVFPKKNWKGYDLTPYLNTKGKALFCPKYKEKIEKPLDKQ